MLNNVWIACAICSGSGAGPSLNDTGIFWSFLMIFSFFLQAADTILKVITNGYLNLNCFYHCVIPVFCCLLNPWIAVLHCLIDKLRYFVGSNFLECCWAIKGIYAAGLVPFISSFLTVRFWSLDGCTVNMVALRRIKSEWYECKVGEWKNRRGTQFISMS